jgi:hypothetical protein
MGHLQIKGPFTRAAGSRSQWARRVEPSSERTKVHIGKLLPLHFPSQTSGTKSLPSAIQCMLHKILFHPISKHIFFMLLSCEATCSTMSNHLPPTNWASSQDKVHSSCLCSCEEPLKCKDVLRFLEKKCHNFLLTTLFCVNERFPCSL